MTMKRDSRYLRRKEEVNIDFTKCKKLMSSNLPLLFANGQPRSLETISQPELEEFVPFMVQCSLGQEILKSPKRINNCPAPDWWPQGLPFKFPLIDQSDWINRLVMLKSLVCRCYTYYNCEFLLKFSSDLADIPPSQLRFEINDDNTTTIYDQNEGMLVKCRNENLNYDLHKNPRRYLSPAHRSSLNQAKKFESVIDLTFDTSSEDEKEVYFKETVAPASRKAGKRKASVEQNGEPVPARRRCLRIFNDFPVETPEPSAYNQEQFMEKFQLLPLGREIPREVMRVERRKRLAKSFSIMSISSRRGQELLAKSRHTFSVESCLIRIEKFCGPEGEEEGESSQVYTRAAATFSAMFKKGEENKQECQPMAEVEEVDEKWCHTYKWVHRTNNPVYPYRGPCVKPCTVMLNKMSRDELEHYLPKKEMCDTSTMTPPEWWSNEWAICKCQLISNKVKKPQYLEGVSYSNKKCSTVCTCSFSSDQYLPFPTEKYTYSEGIKETNKVSQSLDSNRNCDVSSDSDTEYTCSKCEAPYKKSAYRRPLAVVPPMSSTTSMTAPSVIPPPPPLYQNTIPTKINYTRSILDAIKFYTKDASFSVADELRKEIKNIEHSQENIKPTTLLTIPRFAKPIDYFQQKLNVAEYDYCFKKRTPDGSFQLVTRRGERNFFNREPCPSCFQGRNNFCVYEFVRQAKLAGLSLRENQKHLQSWFFRFMNSLNVGYLELSSHIDGMDADSQQSDICV